MISFARGAPAPECLDAGLLADCARVAVERDPSVLAYGPGDGYGPLRELVGARRSFGMGVNGLGLGLIYFLAQAGLGEREWSLSLIWEAAAVASVRSPLASRSSVAEDIRR